MSHPLRTTALLLLIATLLVACAPPANVPTATLTPTAFQPPTSTSIPNPIASPTAQPTLRIAVIGDYGRAGPESLAVAQLVESWNVDFIITTGDNNYPVGSAGTIDRNIGQYYHTYIGNYRGEYTGGSATNRFFPSLGNHDWDSAQAQPYLDYFTLPGNERYYDVDLGLAHIFVLDSDPREPDGVGILSAQAAWLQEVMEASTAAWQLVVAHHPPYSSGHYGPTDWMQWPFAEWGADAVLSGHEHFYERLEVGGLPYIVNGLGGSGSRYAFTDVQPESQFRYNARYGALLIEVTTTSMGLEFVNSDGVMIDSFSLSHD